MELKSDLSGNTFLKLGILKVQVVACWPIKMASGLAHFSDIAKMYLQLPLQQWGADNVYLLVLFIWKVNIIENPISVMGL